MSAELLPCPFCGHKPPEDLIDTLYPNGVFWKDAEEGYRHYGGRDWEGFESLENPCYSMHCSKDSGGCGAKISGDSREEAIAAWNRRSGITPPEVPAKLKESPLSDVRATVGEDAVYCYAVCVRQDGEIGPIEIVIATSGIEALFKYSLIDDETKGQIRYAQKEGMYNVFQVAKYLNKVDEVLVTSFDPNRLVVALASHSQSNGSDK